METKQRTKGRSSHEGRRAAKRESSRLAWVLGLAAVLAIASVAVLGERMIFWRTQADLRQQELDRADQDRVTLRSELNRLEQDNASLQAQLALSSGAGPNQLPIDPDRFADKSVALPSVLEDDPYPVLYAQAGETESQSPDKMVYLTFDDGPSARTGEILDILKENDIKATFFVVGQTSQLAQDMMKRIVEEGHTLAIHTYSHDYRQIYASVDNYLEDFNRIYEWIYEVTGVHAQIFRFAGGSVNGYNEAICTELIAEMDRRGFVHYDWNAVNGDAEGVTYTAAEMAEKALSKLGANRVIVLMHDSVYKSATVQSLQTIIDGYRDRGYSFDRLTPEIKAITFD